jgi:hypothetical protein
METPTTTTPFQNLRQWLSEDIRPTMPKHQVNFVRFQDTGMARPIEKGGLLNRQEDGAVIEEVERGLNLDVLELL